MICPKCKKDSVKKRVNILVEVSPDVDYIDKEIIRTKDSRILTTDVGRATFFCSLCPWFKAAPTFLKTHDKPLPRDKYKKDKKVKLDEDAVENITDTIWTAPATNSPILQKLDMAAKPPDIKKAKKLAIKANKAIEEGIKPFVSKSRSRLLTKS